MDQSALKVSPDFHTQRAVWPQLVVFGPENFNHRPALLFFQLRQQALARAGGGQRGQLRLRFGEGIFRHAPFTGQALLGGEIAGGLWGWHRQWFPGMKTGTSEGLRFHKTALSFVGDDEK